MEKVSLYKFTYMLSLKNMPNLKKKKKWPKKKKKERRTQSPKFIIKKKIMPW